MTAESMKQNLGTALKRLEEKNPFAAEGYLQKAEEEYRKLGEEQKKEVQAEYEEKTRKVFSLMSREIMKRAEEFAEKWVGETFSWTLAGLAEMVENAEEYAEKAREEKPKPSAKAAKLIKIVYNQFLQLDAGKARMLAERKDYHLAKSYLQMAGEILERAEHYGFYSKKEAEEWKTEINEKMKEIDKQKRG